MQDLSLIIPAKYESESLPIFLEEIRKYNCKKIIVLEETDLDTINSIKKFTDVKIQFQKTNGYGSAIIEGIIAANTKYFCIINADGSMNPIYLESMLQQFQDKDIDFLFASRYEKPEGGSDDDNFITLFGNYFFTFLGNLLFRLNISDILFTYVMGKTSIFKSLDLSSKDFTLCVEMPIKAKKQGLKLNTIPSFERSRIGGKKKVNAFWDGLLILMKMIKMFFSK